MRKAFFGVLLAVLAAAEGTAVAAACQEQAQAAGGKQAVSYDTWLAAKLKAEEFDNAGKFVEALQYYLEYTRQAEGLGRRDIAAWGMNNAAYMIIKMHKQDRTVDLAPAKKMLDEAMAIAEATDGCRRLLTTNMAYVKLYMDRTD